MDRHELTQVLFNRSMPRWDLVQGYVVSDDGGTVTVTIGGGTNEITNVKYLGSAPTASAACWLMVNGTDLFVLGQTS